MDKQEKTATIVITDAVKIDGQHHAVGEVLENVESGLAKELAGAGRARLATDEEVTAAAKAATKSAEKSAQSQHHGPRR